MANLRVGSNNYFVASSITREDGATVTISSATAFIFLATDTTETALANSSITLSAVSANMAGTFPATVSLTAGLSYKIRCTITLSDGSIGIEDLEVVASRS